MDLREEEKIVKELEARGIGKNEIMNAINQGRCEAEIMLKDEEKIDKLVQAALNLCGSLSRLPVIGPVFEDLPLACYMVSDFVHKRYTKAPLASIIALTVGISYVLAPADLIPDALPVIGQIDDALVIQFVFSACHNDIMDYRMWREGQNEYLETY